MNATTQSWLSPTPVILALWSSAVLAAPTGYSQSQSEETKTIAIQGATVHTLAGSPVEDGTVLIRDGRIVEVGPDVRVPAGAETIDASGLHVYPGLFDSVTQLGLTEVGAVSATVDTTELGEFNPQLKAITAVHPASEIFPVTRANGITHATAVPGGGRGAQPGISGQASVIHLDGWTAEEMEIQGSVAMVLHWPSLNTRSFDPATFRRRTRPFKEVKKDYDKTLRELRELLASARSYQHARQGDAARTDYDDKLASLGGVVDRSQAVMIRASSASQIGDVLDFAEEENIRVILVGAPEAWKLKERIASMQIPVILGPTQALPLEEDDPYDRAFTTAAELHEAGVKIAFATLGAANSRTLPYEAGQAVGYGLAKQEGLRAVTINPAEILGLSGELGTIEEGKWANLIVTDGDPLEITTRVRHLIIKGDQVSLDNKHLELYEKYRARPK